MRKIVKCEICGSGARSYKGDTQNLCYPCRLKNKMKRPKKTLPARIYVNTTGMFNWKEYGNEIIM
jgi:hypothetical protein